MVLMIDNYDSFTFNLVHYLGELGAAVHTVRNDALSVSDIIALAPERVVISPGPRTPDQAGVSLDAVRAFAGRLPILGVCLGHQAIGQAFGGRVMRADTVVHGKTSPIWHTGVGIFSGLSNPFEAARYHSLVIDPDYIPACLEVTAWTQRADGACDAIMGVRHKAFAVEGVQFHPESIASRHGHDLLRNFLAQPPSGHWQENA